jgi:peptidoglycan/xylan/chitin deacetylase (PgdA/CDA1 family)
VSRSAIIVTYHAVEVGPPPLCIEPALFRKHVECLVGLGATTLTIAQLADALRSGELPPRAVAITFDDGCASAVRVAAPLLADRGLTATFFCVAGYLGRTNEWPTQPKEMLRLELASAGELRGLAEAGFEIGAHGFEHAPLSRAVPELARSELETAKHLIEEAAGVDVCSFAYPYDAPPSAAARALAAGLYGAACVGGPARVGLGTDLLALPRVDVHYLRTAHLLRQSVAGSLGPYLPLRALIGRARRRLREDYLLERG